MSAKWRALQHRHRYTYSAIIFPQYFIDAFHQTPSTHQFYTSLKTLISLNSTYSQLNHAKNLASSFSQLLLLSNNNACDESSIDTACRFYLEILLLENSQPLHRTLLSALIKCKSFHGVIQSCFRKLCEEYCEKNGNGKRFCVSRAALSMMSIPKLGFLVEVVDECAVLVGLDVVLGLNEVLLDINEWSRPSPIVMEQCQEALSCMYYLLQRFPLKFMVNNAGGCDVLERFLVTVLSILKSESFSRDCLVAAGVSFCVALQVCLSLEELGLFIMEGNFNNEGLIMCSEFVFKGVVEKIPFKGDLVDELSKFSSLSRICLIRGILTAVPRAVLNVGFVVSNDSVRDCGDNGKSIKMILYDAILQLCNFCENPIDSHFNFHALTVMQICLQQVKTSMLDKNGSLEVNYDPISEEIGTRLLQIVWNNLEDPLSQTVKQVHLIFDLLLDIQASLHWVEGSDTLKLFMRKVAFDLLRLGPRCKGRYVPLASLTKRLGAKTLLSMSPDLLFETIKAYIDDDVCGASTTFLKCFLECLRDEYWSSDGIENGYSKYRGCCLPPLLSGLASGHSKLRSNLNTYALPVLLELDVDAIFPMLAFISVGCGLDNGEVFLTELDFGGVSPTLEERVAVLVSLFKVSRLLALLEGDIDWCKNSLLSLEDVEQNLENRDAIVCIKGIEIKVPEKYLVLALTHIDESLRIDAAESLFINPKTASLPSSLELSLMKVAIPLNMRCCSTAFQMKWTSLFRKFFSRVRTALERQVKQGSWQPLAGKDTSRDSVAKGTGDMFQDRADELFNFMKWLSCFLFFSCYPSAPYERKIMAMDLLLIMLNVWSIVGPSEGNVGAVSPEFSLYPYSKGLLLPESTLLLVGSIVDSWDRLRESSFRILLHFPTPLPGINSQDMVSEAIVWAKKLVCSPRVRESDAGALTLRLIFRKYVLELGWVVNVSSNTGSPQSLSKLPNGENKARKLAPPAIEYLRSLIDWLEALVQDGEKDLSEACKNSFVHGALLALRYTFEELDWDSDAIVCSTSEMKVVLEKILELVMRITSLALGVVSADAWYLPDDMEEMGDDALLLEVPHEVDESLSTSDKVQNTEVKQEGRGTEQIVMVGCWLAMKEVSLLLGTIIRKVPLPTSNVSESGCQVVHETDLSNRTSGAMLDVKQLEVIGNHFLEVLLKMKHNGAIDKTRAGFTALCNRLLCSNDARLCRLTESWMEQLMERTIAKGQTVDDLLRRSAGIPAAFIAFFLSEPQGTPKRLLPRALRWLVDVANKSLTDHSESNSFSADACNGFGEAGPAIFSKIVSDIYEAERISKIRDEGVVPTVHAFNVLKAAFNDTNLATDTSGFSAEALIISIRCFSSPHWEVRNSACLAYTALVRRMIGFLNVHKRASVRRAITGLEFFHRYPSLHPFLFNELKIATESLLDGSSEHLRSNLAKVVHPSLCPVLILFSRLKPSPIASEAGDSLDPFLFMPFIRKCSVQSNLRIRVLASRALTGLVSNEKLPLVLLNIASELPGTGKHVVNPESSMSSNRVNSSFNSLHGMLLQLSSLLDTNCRDLADVSQKDNILTELIHVLASRSWIGSPEQCPCPIINGCFLKVLDNMLSVARTCQTSKNIDVIWDLLWRSSSECLDLGVASAPTYFDPTISELRKQAACSYFNCVYQTSKEAAEDYLLVRSKGPPSGSNLSNISVNEISFSRFQERLIRSISDTSYEVRIATLKWFLLFLKTPDYSEIKRSCLTSIDLQTTMMKLLTLDNNHKCLNYILKIIYSWSLQEYHNNGEECYPKLFGAMDSESVLKFWDKAVSLYKVTRHSKTREMLLCCMGICIKHFVSSLSSSVVSLQSVKAGEFSHHDDLSKSSVFYECISYYVDLIEQHSDASEPVNMRRAAAESMIASGLLDQAEVIGPSVYGNQIPDGNWCSPFKLEMVVNRYAHKILDLWFTCIRLLEDEDESLRRKLAVDVQNCLTSKTYERSFLTGMVPSQVEQVIERSFEHLSSIFGHCVDYLDFLCRRVLDSANHSCVISEGDLIKRVFDKEIDNHHEEKLLICQICCSHLEKLPTSKFSLGEPSDIHDVNDFLQNWRRRFARKLVLFAKDYVAAQGGFEWIGGFGNHKDAFLPLYANLLAFYALSNCIFNGQQEDRKLMLPEVQEIGEAIQPFLTNPLISNLFILAVKFHNKMICEGSRDLSQKATDESAWDAFDPYFLLR
ncbi:uncharacterized protein LOC132617203 isoform X1 [Lycium barbarum]|uniref:uncharacterized protein LOC132617203 isoform X1 n=1 Tax=Lycium barbarum TaxID=112863 RepID=UPI00293EBF46|nr:uncharacterized protein LOC132617203 isoform X1 [Lycium barbarum]